MTEKEKKIVKELKEKLAKECSDKEIKEIKDSELLLMYTEYMNNNYGTEHSGKIFDTDLYKNKGSEYCLLLEILHWYYVPRISEMNSFKNSVRFYNDIVRSGNIPKGCSPLDMYVFRDALEQMQESNKAEFIEHSVADMFTKCGMRVVEKGIGYQINP